MAALPLDGKAVLITGAARRIGRAAALACARQGADLLLHFGQSEDEVRQLEAEIAGLGRQARKLQADLQDPMQVQQLMERAASTGPLFSLVNNAAIFESVKLADTTLEQWDRHLAINLTAPFLLSQAFARQVPAGAEGRIVNLLDWRALRPGFDHFPYTISKAGLAALTASLALALAPNISVNGLALGAILPPSGEPASEQLIKRVPAGRWGAVQDVEQALIFLLTGPSYITGEIIHVDGGRHLV
jgi:NAD(P)-dependent dehydrogenase (short-subunit alcohol dehydrogenase family)